MNRGLSRRSIFLVEEDRRLFLSRFVRAVRRTTLALQSSVLMENHFHLVATSWPGEKVKSGWPILEVGLLRSLCGLRYAEISVLVRKSYGAVRNWFLHHQELLTTNGIHTPRCEAATSSALKVLLPAANGSLRGRSCGRPE